MGNKCREILIGLDKVEKIIADFNAITLTQGSDSVSIFTHIQLNCRILKSKLPEDEIIGPELLIQLQNELKSIESSTAEILQFSLTQDSKLYNIQLDETFNKFNFEQIEPLLAHFKTLVKERNISCVQQLVQFKEENNEIKRNQLKKINQCIEAIKQNPEKLSVQQDEINSLLTKPRVSTRIKNCSYLSDSLSESSLIESSSSKTEDSQEGKFRRAPRLAEFSSAAILEKEINERNFGIELKKRYENFTSNSNEFTQKIFNENELIEYCQNDSVITEERIRLSGIVRETEELIRKMIQSWFDLYKIFKTEHHPTLDSQLTETINKISELQKQKNQIKTTILDRQNYLMPSSEISGDQLNDLLIRDKKELIVILKDFFTRFINIEKKFKKDKISTTAIESFKEYINVIFRQLQIAHIPLNKKNLDDFEKQFLYYLDESNTPISGKIPLPLNEVSQNLLNSLVVPPSEIISHFGNADETKRKQIIAVRSFIDVVKKFPVKEIEKLYDLKTTIEIQDKTILREKSKIDTTDLIEKLKCYIHLLTSKFESDIILIESTKIINQLARYNQALEEKYQDYCNEKTELTRLRSASESLTKTINCQKDFLSNLTKMSDEIKAPTGLHSIALAMYEKLEAQYKIKMNWIEKDITTTFNNICAALKIFYTEEEIQTLISKDLAKIEAQKKSKLPLVILKEVIELILRDVEKHIQTTRNRLANEYEPILKNLEDNSRLRPLFHNDNPVKDSLTEKNNLILNQIKLANEHYSRFKFCKPSELQLNLSELKKIIGDVEQDLKNYQSMIKVATEIDNTCIYSKEYQVSTGIIKTLTNEYLRIRQKKIPQALKIFGTMNEEIINKKLDECLNLDKLNEDKINFLNTIDPRLFKIRSIINDFNNLNREFLFGEHSTRNFLTLLIAKVNTHLHNNEMEHFSDEKRSSFVQFIRIYIIKPIQIVINEIDAWYNNKNSQNCFFPTAFATKTEAILVEIGNEAFKGLQPVSAV